MFYALLDDERVTAEPGLAGAVCPLCGSAVRAKCGRIVVWHFAHVAAEDCDSWAEPDNLWHRRWEDRVPVERREVTIGNHRADIVTASGRVVELQHSAISPDEIREREAFYGPGMIWIFDATEARADGRLMIRRRQNHVTFRWMHPRKTLSACRRRVLLDLGDGYLLDMRQIYTDAPCGGWGFEVSLPQIVNELNGSFV